MRIGAAPCDNCTWRCIVALSLAGISTWTFAFAALEGAQPVIRVTTHLVDLSVIARDGKGRGI